MESALPGRQRLELELRDVVSPVERPEKAEVGPDKLEQER